MSPRMGRDLSRKLYLPRERSKSCAWRCGEEESTRRRSVGETGELRIGHSHGTTRRLLRRPLRM